MGAKKVTVAILGCGVLGRLIAQGLRDADGGQSYKVLVTQRTAERAQELAQDLGVKGLHSNPEAAAAAEILILAVRPQSMADLLQEIASSVKPDALCISIAAGLPLQFYEDLLPAHTAVMRAHPSPMMEVRKGFIALARGTRAEARDVKEAERLFSFLCEETLLLPERDINMFAALFGSSSALLYLFVEALLSVANEAEAPDFSPTRIIAGMLHGAAQMLVATSKSPRELCDEICTPNGMTIAGVQSWQQTDVSRLVAAAMKAILLRVEEMRGSGIRERPSSDP